MVDVTIEAVSPQIDLFEYAVSAGEGTLLSFGVIPTRDFSCDVVGLYDDETIIVAPCADDCETGL